MNEELRYEIQDVKRAIGALQRRITKIEEFAQVDVETPKLNSTNLPSLANFAPPTSPVVMEPKVAAMSGDPSNRINAFIGKKLQSSIIEDCADAQISSVVPFKDGNDQSDSTGISSQSFLLKQIESRGAASAVSEPHCGPAPSSGIQQSNISPDRLQEGLEIWIGKNLNKIGISFLVIGCALALIYQYQYFTPLLKILAGVLFGASLIALGEWFEKKSSFDWYGRALTGGGWSLAYFSVYAAYHFKHVQVIDNVVVDLSLLLCIAAGAVWHSLKYKSETITGLSFILSFVTICLSHVSAFSVLACAFLVLGMSALTAKMRWFNLFLVGEAIVYGIYFWVLLPQISAGENQIFGFSVLESNFWVAASFSTFCWMAFNYLSLELKYQSPYERKFVISATVLNSLAFVPTVLQLMAPVHPEWQFSFLFSAAAVYGLLSLSHKKKEMSGVSTLHTAIALLLLTVAIPYELKGDWVSALWCLEVPLLIWTGLKYEMPIMRQFAAGLACVCFANVFGGLNSHSLIMDATASIALALASTLYRIPWKSTSLVLSDRMAFHSYFLATILAVRSVIAGHTSTPWLALAYVIAGVVATILGLKLKDQFARLIGAVLVYGFAAFSFISAIDDTARLGSAIIVGLLFYLSHRYKRVEGNEHYQADRVMQFVHLGAAISVLTVLIGQIAPVQLISPAWAAEGLLVLLYGFIRQDKRTRVAAFAVLSASALRFALWDMPSEQLFICDGFIFHQRILNAILDVSVLSIAASCYAAPRLRTISGELWSTGFYAYMALTGLCAGLLTLAEAPHDWVALFISLECLVPIALGFILDLVPLRITGAIGLFGSQFTFLLSNLNHWDPLATGLIICLQFSLAHFYRITNRHCQQESDLSSPEPSLLSNFEDGIEHCYGMAGSITCGLLLMQASSVHLLTIAWTIESIALLISGFYLKDKPYRISGLVLLALVIIRLLFVELASLETIYRIISFIAAGLVLLLASLAYTLNSSRLGARAPRSLDARSAKSEV